MVGRNKSSEKLLIKNRANLTKNQESDNLKLKVFEAIKHQGKFGLSLIYIFFQS